MTTITKRSRKDGTHAYRAEIKIKRHGKIFHQESRTIDNKMLAAKWALQREIDLESDEVLAARPRPGSLPPHPSARLDHSIP